MPIIKPFRALRFAPDRINQSESYDVPESIRVTDALSDERYVLDPKPFFYIDRMIRNGHIQTGIVACVDMKDYRKGRIKRHELIRPAKVDFQTMLLDDARGNTEPVLLAYDSKDRPLPYVNEYADTHKPLYDFAGPDDTIHQIWAIEDAAVTGELTSFFAFAGSLYICDGHHRIAAAAAYAERFDAPESRWLMAMIFPSDEMMILDFNRAVADRNGLSTEELIDKLRAASFETECVGTEPYRPTERGEYAMVTDDTWYRLRYTGPRDMNDPVASLDVSILQNKIIDPILGIVDPTHDERLTFLRGSHGLSGLQAMTHRGMKIAFAVKPVTMDEIRTVADGGLTMPPKSTCFEPKPVKNVLIHPFTI